MANSVEEAIDAMSVRDVERILALAQRRLRSCAMCSQDGAYPVTIHWKAGGVSHKAAMLICPRCLEQHRLPQTRSG